MTFELSPSRIKRINGIVGIPSHGGAPSLARPARGDRGGCLWYLIPSTKLAKRRHDEPADVENTPCQEGSPSVNARSSRLDQPLPLRSSRFRKTSSSEISAGQPYAAATAVSSAAWASASHCGRAL